MSCLVSLGFLNNTKTPSFNGLKQWLDNHPTAAKVTMVASLAIAASVVFTGVSAKIVATTSVAVLAHTVKTTLLPHFTGLGRIPILDENNNFYPSNKELACHKPGKGYKCEFTDYREPNEGTPKNIKAHLNIMEKGWIVSTGTERSFFNLLLSPQNRCEGLIIRDINPKVKSYCDSLILLLYISDSLEEFIDLSAKSKKFSEEKKIRIREKIISSDMSSKMKEYHLDNFIENGRNYLDCEHLPSIKTFDGTRNRVGDNTGVDYHKDRCLFDKLQQYARKGRIIATVGGIDNLKFVGDRVVAVVDVSNIPDYTPLNFQGNGRFQPRIIHNRRPPSIETRYCSYVHKNISTDLQKRIENQLRKLEHTWKRSGKFLNDTIMELITTKVYRERNAVMIKYYNSFGRGTKFIYGIKKEFSDRILRHFFEPDIFNSIIPNAYSEEFNRHLEEYFLQKVPPEIKEEFPLDETCGNNNMALSFSRKLIYHC